GATPDAPAPYVAMCHLLCDSVEAYESAYGPHVQEIRADIRNFTNQTHTLRHTPADANVCLMGTHRIGFEEVVFHIERGDLLDILEHPNPERYGGQRIFVVRREGYEYLAP